MSAPEAAEPLAPLSREWFDMNIAANEQIAQQKLIEWQQVLGALDMLRKLRDLAAQAEQDKKE